jgi:hypothetical protein
MAVTGYGRMQRLWRELAKRAAHLIDGNCGHRSPRPTTGSVKRQLVPVTLKSIECQDFVDVLDAHVGVTVWMSHKPILTPATST